MILTGKRFAHDGRERDLAVPKVRSCWMCGGVRLLANSVTAQLRCTDRLLPAYRLPYHTHVFLLQARLSQVCIKVNLHFPEPAAKRYICRNTLQ